MSEQDKQTGQPELSEEVILETPEPEEVEPESIAEAAETLEGTLVKIKMEEVKSLGEALAVVTSLGKEMRDCCSEMKANLEQIQTLKEQIETATLGMAVTALEIAEEVKEEIKEETPTTSIIPAEIKSNPNKKTGLGVFFG